MADLPNLTPSPNGDLAAPALSGNLGKILAGVVSCAAVVLPLIPGHTIFASILSVLVGLGGAFGIVSAGTRK